MNIKIKNEKGYTVIDIATAVIVLFIFVSVIAILIYNFNSSSKEISIKGEATAIAVEEIEKIKSKSVETIYEDLTQEGIEYGNSYETATAQEVKEGFFRKVIIQDYNELNPERSPNVIKKIIVQVKYKFKTEERTVELASIMSKRN